MDRLSLSAWSRTPAGIGVWVLLIFTVVALAGFGIFGMHPQRIPQSLLGFWQVSYKLFARMHIIVGFGALALALVPLAGIRWLPSLVVVYGLSLTAEYVGTGYGIPFGAYGYTSLLGAQIGGRVPWVIPLSWYLMTVPAWILARETFPQAGAWIARILFASVILTLWDLALDPAMSFQPPYYWTWGATGPYYGMPWINLLGWVLTGVVLMSALELTGIRSWGREISSGWAAAYYGVTVLMPWGMLVLKGLWLGVWVTVLSMVVAYGFHRFIRGARVS